MAIELIVLTSASLDAADRLVHLVNDVLQGEHSLGFLQDLDRASAYSFLEQTLPIPKSCFIVAIDGDQYIGAGKVGPSAYLTTQHYAEISKMMVRRNFQGRGIGLQLLQRLEKEASSFGYSDIILDTWDIPKILSFYERSKYQKAGVIPHFVKDQKNHYHDSYVYVKKL